MIACYDLARCPPTFDVVAWLALAELERRRRGDEHLDVCILPGPVGGFRRDSLWPRSVEERVQLRDRVLVPVCRLLPSVRSVSVINEPSRHELQEEWGYGAYLVGLPRILEALRGACRPLRAERYEFTLIPGRRLVTFTLREAEHHALRNSQIDEWMAAASVLDYMGFAVAVIRDTRMEGIDIPVQARDSNVFVLTGTASVLARRAAAYSAAALNVGISNGPMWMSIFMDAPTLMLRPTTNAAGGCYDDRFYARCGLPRGSQLPTSPPHQRLVWEGEDTCDNIVRAIEEMMEVLP